MITLLADQPVAGQQEYAVLTAGDYAPEALVDCYSVLNPANRVAFYACFCADGTYP